MTFSSFFYNLYEQNKQLCYCFQETRFQCEFHCAQSAKEPGLCEKLNERSGVRLGRDTNNTFSSSLVRASLVRLCRYVKTILRKTFVLQSALRADLKLGLLQQVTSLTSCKFSLNLSLTYYRAHKNCLSVNKRKFECRYVYGKI